MWRAVLVYCCIFSAVNGFNFKIRRPISKCIKHKGPLPLGAEVEGCSNAPPPCALTGGENALIAIAFSPPRYTTTMHTRITTYQTIHRVVYDMAQDIGEGSRTCNFLLDATCPVRHGEILLYQLQMHVNTPNFKPGEATAAEIRILDDKDEEIMCIRVEYVIKLPRGQHDYKTRVAKMLLEQTIYNGK